MTPLNRTQSLVEKKVRKKKKNNGDGVGRGNNKKEQVWGEHETSETRRKKILERRNIGTYVLSPEGGRVRRGKAVLRLKKKGGKQRCAKAVRMDRP